MKTIMILSGGTSTAWHIAYVIHKYYKKYAKLIICDINPSYLVHTSVLADAYIQVPLIKSDNYYSEMLKIIKENRVDIIVPLIDEDIKIFSNDNNDLEKLDAVSVAPPLNTINSLSDKRNMFKTLNAIGVITPKIYTHTETLDANKQYFVKDAIGCGSKGAFLIKGLEAKKYLDDDNKIVQEVCVNPEITVDTVVDGKEVYTICRERKEIKLGVSTKCKIYTDKEIQGIIEKISSKITLPTISCIQFMKNTNGEWTLTDFNLRSGGGTAISCAVGFEAVRYGVATWLGLPKNHEWLHLPENDKYVVRRYEEVVTL